MARGRDSGGGPPPPRSSRGAGGGPKPSTERETSIRRGVEVLLSLASEQSLAGAFTSRYFRAPRR